MFLKLNRACWALALALLGAANVHAQGHIPGEFIVMFHAQQDAEKFASAYGFEWAQALSPRAHIHLLRLQGETTSAQDWAVLRDCLLNTSPSPRDLVISRMPSSA